MVEAEFKMPGGMRGAADALRAGGLCAPRCMHAPARGTATAMGGASSARKMCAGGGSREARAFWRGAPGGCRTRMPTEGTLFAYMPMTGARSHTHTRTRMPGTAKAPGRAPVQMMQPRSGLVFKTRTLPGKNSKNCPIYGDLI